MMENSIASSIDWMLSSSVKRTIRCLEYSSAKARKIRLKAATESPNQWNTAMNSVRNSPTPRKFSGSS